MPAILPSIPIDHDPILARFFVLYQIAWIQAEDFFHSRGLQAFALAAEHYLPFLMRHAQGDWGMVCLEDAEANDQRCEVGERILSSYKLQNGTKFWIMTEADRSSTCILLPEEY